MLGFPLTLTIAPYVASGKVWPADHRHEHYLRYLTEMQILGVDNKRKPESKAGVIVSSPDDSKSLKADILYDNWHIILKNARAVNYKERLSSCYKLKENKGV